jgi:enterobactin synthetase component D
VFRIVHSPAVTPAFVRRCSIVFDSASNDFPSIAIPDSLGSAVAKRKLEFAAGRYCAQEALGALAPDAAVTPVGISQDRSPAWPPGFVGSITHTHGFASAAVARMGDALSVGIDSETIIEASTVKEVAPSICSLDEFTRLSRKCGESDELLITAIFSAKESIFKCLHRFVGQYFDFLDVEMTVMNFGSGDFTARLVHSLADPLPADSVVCGRMSADSGRVHTGLVLVELSPRLRFA